MRARLGAPHQDALTAGCRRLFTDVISRSTASRPGPDEALSYLKGGDTLVVWRLDDQEQTIIAITCRSIGISRPTLYRA
jgi:DNA invertase Pin-like site-specific DNA recombinase